MKKIILAAAAAIAMAAPAQAVTLLSDTFDTDGNPATVAPGTSTNLNFDGFTNFDANGNVDLVQSGDFGITCSGKCVDLDGTTGPGEIQTKASYGFVLGDIISFNFRVGGNQRGGGLDDLLLGFRSQGGAIAYNDVKGFINGVEAANFGSFFQNDFNTALGPFASGSVFLNGTVRFTAGNSGSFKSYLGTASADNVGPLIDSVSLTSAVPEPATWAMMIMGFGVVGGALRRRKPQAQLNFA